MAGTHFERSFLTIRDTEWKSSMLLQRKRNLIYNNVIGGEIRNLEELLSKNELLAGFKAVKNGNVWCTRRNIFQETISLVQMVQSFHGTFNAENIIKQL